MNQILRQNAEDENQNSIHVELGQAVTRIHELAAENQLLREVILDTPFVRARTRTGRTVVNILKTGYSTLNFTKFQNVDRLMQERSQLLRSLEEKASEMAAERAQEVTVQDASQPHSNVNQDQSNVGSRWGFVHTENKSGSILVLVVEGTLLSL